MSKTIRRYLWLATGIFNRHKKLILSAFFGGLVLFIVGIQLAPFISARVQTKPTSIGKVGLFTPTNLPLEVQRFISIGLTDVDTQGIASPALAESWSISSDGKEYLFKLKSNVFWHDGKLLTAHDINYNLKDVQFSAIADDSLKVTLKEAFTPLPSFLSKPLFRKGLIGVGGYKVGSIRLKGEYITYVRLIPVTGELPHLEVKFYPTESIAKTAFKLGEVAVLDEITDHKEFTEWKTVGIKETVKYNQTVGIFFNLEDELLKDKEVRQALAFMVDKPEKNRVASPLSSQSWAYTNQVKQYEKDEEQAMKLYTAPKNKERPVLTLSTFPQYLGLAHTIAAAWNGLGIATKVKVEDSIPDTYQALLVTQEIPADPDQYPVWHSTQIGSNITKYNNPKIDKLLEDGRKEQNQEKRKKIYFDFQRYLVEDVPAIFMFHPTTYTISRSN